jgi:hypothetical protein
MSEATLKRFATWKSAFVVSLGGSVLVAVSLGPMASVRGACLAELGVEQTEERRSHRSM